jgi:predicted AlkP superfamily pyrophosphatase or phosphodiesterase
MQTGGLHRQLSLLVLVVLAHFGTDLFAEEPAAVSQRVVVVVWDGMRPDMVSEKNTPTLWKFAHEGVTFRNHHSVYPSATNVNGIAMVTGVYPARSGIIANHEYRPEIDERNAIDVEDPAIVRKADEVYGGTYVAVPTLAELVRASGRRTVIASAKGVGLLQDRHVDPARAQNSNTLFSGKMQSADALANLVTLLGPFSNLDFSHKDSWTTKALTDFFWKEGIGDFSLLWLSQPDGTQHDSAPGSAAALAGLKSSDDNLARVLTVLDRHAVRSTTDIFVLSDHGFSTIERAVDVRERLRAAGFQATTAFENAPQPGQVMIAGNGGSVFFYVIGHDAAVTNRLAEFLQQSDFAGVIFTRDKLPGTFSLADGKIDNPHAPDVAMAFGWNENKNRFGVSGLIDADWQRKAGEGTHATLSRFDMHNTLVAAGPHFRRGGNDDLPSGNVDVAPTICAILGINTPPMDGRVLTEAMNVVARVPETDSETIEATRNFRSGTWRQSLRISLVGGTIYLDEGNGSFASKK